jgi:hypothetical protein
MNSRQRQRWSLMTVLYLVVRTSFYTIAWLANCADSKYYRYATLEYHIMCMFFRLKIGAVLIAHLS